MVKVLPKNYYWKYRHNKIPRKNKKDERRNKEIIRNFMIDRLDYPDWFRGMSKSQMDAAESLLNCLRDDNEQGTTHRIRNTLRLLGIEPALSPKEIQVAMALSRGNDIAFLWFLMELYYRGDCNKCEHKLSSGYNLVEQIVMTAIAHLDTIPTLRELDKILPVQPEKPKIESVPKRKKPPPNYPLPYFAKQVQPVMYGESLLSTDPDRSPNINEYEDYLNPNYAVPNERSRWYADYKLNDGKRMAKMVIDDQLKCMFEPSKCEHFSQYDDDVTLEAKAEAVTNLFQEKLTKELAAMKQNLLEKYFNVEGHQKQQSYKRVVKFINEGIENAQETVKKSTRYPCFPSKNKEKKVSIVPPKPEETAKEENEESEDKCYSKYDVLPQSINKPIYFEAPTGHTPYKFNYDLIFNQTPKDLIREKVYEILKEEGNLEIYEGLDPSEIIQQVCDDLWLEQVKIAEAKYYEEHPVVRKPKKGIMGKYDLPYYDPYDRELMKNLLIDAMRVMRRNRKFVLVTFPDAYKTPVLKQFIMKRYGFLNMRTVVRSDYKLSKRIFNLLKKSNYHFHIPSPDDIAEKRMVSYGCRDYIDKKTNYLRDIYQHNFKQTLLEDIRNYWGAVRPYSCTNGPPRKQFFAYLPARENDIHLFRPWKSDEYIRAKEQWDRQQVINRLKEKI